MTRRSPAASAASAWTLLLAATLVLVATGTAPRPAAAQAAATLPPLDEAYHDLERLEAFGLVPRGGLGLAPYSRGRVAWLARDARGWLAGRTDLDPAARRDLEAILDRLERRFGAGAGEGAGRSEGAAPRPALAVEVEAFGGESPGAPFPDDWLGGLDAVLNPLWGGRGGRAYPDRGGAAVALRGDLPVGDRFALTGAVRGSGGSWSGGSPRPGRRDLAVEALSARAVLGRVAVQGGRDHVWTRRGGWDGALLSPHGPSLDMLRISTERPLPLHLLGELDVALFAADLGPRQNFPHARLFGVLFTARPAAGLDLGLTLLNKQMGEGAPPATARERLEDLLLAWVWLDQESRTFSDKSLAVSLAKRWDAARLFAEASFNDVDTGRPRHTFAHGGAYRVGVGLPRLGAAGRHALEATATYAGQLTYRHHDFTTGAAVDGYLQGALPGPASRRLEGAWAWSAPAAGWRTRVALAAEERDGDVWREDEADRDRLVRVEALPDEVRLRARASVARALAEGRGGVEVMAGVERARNAAHVEGAGRWRSAGLLRVWWGF